MSQGDVGSAVQGRGGRGGGRGECSLVRGGSAKGDIPGERRVGRIVRIYLGREGWGGCSEDTLGRRDIWGGEGGEDMLGRTYGGEYD